MDLIFLGRGAGFNPKEGSTSAYFIDNEEMFLIDCGESVFKTIIQHQILDRVKALNIMITHTHADHVGSLGSLMLYAYAAKQITVKLITHEAMEYLPRVQQVLTIFGLTESMYSLASTNEYKDRYTLFKNITFIKVPHTSELASCGIIFETSEGLLFYSGDLNTTGPLEELLKGSLPIDRIYIDAASQRDNPHHVSIHHINDVVPEELKSKVYCMHINSDECLSLAESYGFKVVSVL